MNLRRALLRAVYPAYRWLEARFTKRGEILINHNGSVPAVSLYSLSARLNDGSILQFEQFRGRKVLIVNTASDCVYTAQYAELAKMPAGIQVIAFPSNDFKEQEKGTDGEIAAFCQVNYGVKFPVASKTAVTGGEMNTVFDWLTDPAKNGWNSQGPSWNFSKYLVNELGVLTHYFGPATTPDDVAQIAAGN